MSIASDRYWHEKMVMSYLQDAAAIHRRLPPVKVPTYHSLWPETLKDDWQRFHDAVNGKTKLGAPYPAEVSFSDDVLGWLRWIDRRHQQIVFMRANNIPWKLITDQLERGQTALWHDMNNGLTQIGMRLEAKDPLGEHYRRLRLRANGIFDDLQKN